VSFCKNLHEIEAGICTSFYAIQNSPSYAYKKSCLVNRPFLFLQVLRSGMTSVSYCTKELLYLTCPETTIARKKSQALVSFLRAHSGFQDTPIV